MEVIVFIVILGLLFDYTNGFQDSANVVSTVIATKALRPLVAIVLAGILNAFGATQISGIVKTITTGLVNPEAATQLTVLCALFGAIVWNLVTWWLSIPSSSSYALIGGLVGAVLVHAGQEAIFWKGVLTLVIIPMVIAPFIGFFLAFLVVKGLKREWRTERHVKVFQRCQIASASLVAIAHGVNDAQKSMGIITLGLFTAGLIQFPTIPLWVILSCALMMGLGTALGGYRIIRTVGFKITKLEPAQGFAAEMSSSLVILFASFYGMPISSTHLIVSSVTGVGSAKGLKAVNWLIAHKLAAAWLVTLPASALISAGAYSLLSLVL